MNSDVMHSRVQMEPAILKNLMTEVKETVATDVVFEGPRQRSFGVVQLWGLRRKSRYASNARKQPRIKTGFGY